MNRLVDAGTTALVTIACYFTALTLNAFIEAYFAYKEHRNS
jgi:hypothetical protein